MVLPIRTRLTLWYSAILSLTLIVFGVAAYFTMRSTVQASIDIDLNERLASVETFMIREIPRFSHARLLEELEENVQLQPATGNPDEPIGGEMLQISDSAAHLIFQSRAIRKFALAAPKSNRDNFSIVYSRNVPLRVRTAALRINGEEYVIQLATKMGLLYGALDRFARIMVASFPILVLAASLGGYWLSGRALSPVHRIIQESRKIGHHNLSERLIVPGSHDELQLLSETLNEMIERLELAFKRVTQFTADASHELRSPVAFIRTTAEVALLKPRKAEVYNVALSEVLDEAERMTELIENLLVLARADASTSTLNLTSIDLREPLRSAFDQLFRNASGKEIRFTLSLPDAPVCALGDPTALRRLILILIDNAIKYTPAKGQVSVSLIASDVEALISVQDSGIGIAEQEIERIFERFYRSDKARHRDSGGAGLGLSIARWIAEAHRAQILVTSELGLGSRFLVTLLLAG